MRSVLRGIGWKVAPSVMADRALRFEHRYRAERGLIAEAEAFIQAHGDGVLEGPFTGMRYHATGDAAIAKLRGSYEREIRPWIEAALLDPPPLFVDLGAADGYYAVGMARHGIPVQAFDLSRLARRECQQIAAANDVTLGLRGKATPRRLARAVVPGALVLSDIEGFEVDLFTERVARALSACTVIVEIHEDMRPGAERALREAFSATHAMEVVEAEPREAGDLDELRGPGTRWARFTPLDPPAYTVRDSRTGEPLAERVTRTRAERFAIHRARPGHAVEVLDPAGRRIARVDY